MVRLYLHRMPDGRKRGYLVQKQFKHLSSQDWARRCHNSASCTSSPALVIFHAQSSCAHLSFCTKLAIAFVETPHSFFRNERINAVLGIPMEEVLQVHISSRQCLLFLVFSPLNAPCYRGLSHLLDPSEAHLRVNFPARYHGDAKNAITILRPLCHSISLCYRQPQSQFDLTE